MLSHVLAACVGAVIAFAGATKVADMKRWRRDAQAQHIWKVIALPMPFVELLVGATLVVLRPKPLTLGIATSLLVMFCAFLVVRIAEKSTVPCACFGSWSLRPPSKRDVARNLLMIAVLFVSAAIN